MFIFIIQKPMADTGRNVCVLVFIDIYISKINNDVIIYSVKNTQFNKQSVLVGIFE